MLIPYTHKTLPNGLQVFLKEVHSAPVISWWLAYRIGSRNERTGQTGISHWCEHMMFKGTEQHPPGWLDKAVDRAGGMWNAFTSMDFTMYFMTLPANHIEIALAAEADRMVNAAFDPDEVGSERTVIISERHGAENNPMFWLSEEIKAAAFRVHGYHHEIIGDLTDLETITRDDLYGHYRRHYLPANAYAIAVGDFDTAAMLERIEALYGDLPTAPAPQLFSRPEPQPMGERRVTVRRPGQTGFLQIAHHAPAATDPDWFAMEVLDTILAGSGDDNKTSRLHQALIRSEIALSASGSLQETIDPYLYNLRITLRDETNHRQAEDVLLGEIARLQTDGVTEAELAKAKKQARAAFAFTTESVTDQAYWLAQSAILGEPTWFNQYVDRINAVTAADVQSVAQRYLREDLRVVGWLIPTGAEEASA
jgi:zinc protease